MDLFFKKKKKLKFVSLQLNAKFARKNKESLDHGDATHVQKRQKQKHNALKLSHIILSTKIQKEHMFLPPLSA